MDALELTINAADGFSLGATVFRSSDRWAIINSATGVRRGYYLSYARFLAGNGFSVVSYDYRGIGDSRPASLKGFEACMQDWGILDFNGVLDWTRRQSPSRIAVIGHSIGGQLMAFARRAHEIDALLCVACQSGYFGHWPTPWRHFLWALWRLGVPVLTRLAGYFPSGLIGWGEDLPKGVARQWALWCRHPGYYQGDTDLEFPGFEGFRGPICSYTFSDDRFCPPAAAEAFLDWFPHSSVSRHRFEPAELNLDHLGHFAFFRSRFESSFWHPAVDWLNRALAAPEGDKPAGGESTKSEARNPRDE